jgi:hypothetical protein
VVGQQLSDFHYREAFNNCNQAIEKSLVTLVEMQGMAMAALVDC